jgi:anti-sigma-K factor RskA
MNCDETEELLGAYALDALPDDDAALVREHLPTCDKHAAAAGLRSTATRIAATVDGIAPPAALRSRVLDTVSRTAQDAPDARTSSGAGNAAANGARVASAPSKVVPLRRRVPVAWAAIAAVLVAAVIGLGAWNIVLQRGSGDDVGALATRATSVSALKASGTTASGFVIYYKDEKKALIVTDGVPSLDASRQAYQLWAISDGAARSLGLMPPPVEGSSVIVVPFDASKEQQIAVSVEPPGGSAQPTTAPVLVGDV